MDKGKVIAGIFAIIAVFGVFWIMVHPFINFNKKRK